MSESDVERKAVLVANVYQAADTLAQLTHLTNAEAMKVLDLIVLRDQEGFRFEFFEKALSRPKIDLMTGKRRD